MKIDLDLDGDFLSIMLTINLFDIFRNILPFGVYKFTENLTKK
jgi:hypothetical protein